MDHICSDNVGHEDDDGEDDDGAGADANYADNFFPTMSMMSPM